MAELAARVQAAAALLELPAAQAAALLELPAAQAAALLTPGAPQPTLAQAGDALAHELSKLTLLVSHAQMPAWESADGRALAAGLEAAVVGVCALCAQRAAHACGAYRDALHRAARAAVNACAALAAALTASAAGSVPAADAAAAGAALLPLTSAALEACSALRAAPRDNRAALSRALVRRGAAVKDALREAKELAAAPTAEDGAAPDGEIASDSESCDYDATATVEEAQRAEAATPLLAASLALLQPLLRAAAAAAEPPPEEVAAADMAALDGVLSAYDTVACEAEAFAAALWPPQEPPLLRRHAAGLAAAAAAVPGAAAALRRSEDAAAAQLLDGELARALADAAAAVADAHRVAAGALRSNSDAEEA